MHMKILLFKLQHLKINNKTALRRIVSFLLCICMVIPGLCGVLSMNAFAAGQSGPTAGVTRQADPSTMDTYQQMLDFSQNTRYAGRLWSDKTVFAYGSGDSGDRKGNWLNNTLNLDESLDGVGGQISLNDDFMHVYSALGSSLEFNDSVSAPIDLVILLDMSGSMGTDVVDGQNHADGSDDSGQRVQHSRIQQVLNSINKAIDYLMSLNDTNRVCVVGYGGTAYTLLPLDHYTTTNSKTENGEKWGVYLSVENFRDYIARGGGPLGNTSGSAAYTVHADATGTVNNKVDRRARNDYAVNDGVNNQASLKLIGFNTNLQAGIWQGFNELYNSIHGINDVTYTYTSKLTNEKTTIARIPVAFVMTDGGSNYTVKATNADASGNGDEWYNLTVPEQLNSSSTGYNDAQKKKYRAEASSGVGGDAVILDILLTASYMKSKIQNKYTELLQGEGILDESKDEKADFQIHSISVDAQNVDAYQIPRIYAGLDPKDFFKSAADLKAVAGIATDPTTWKYKESITSAYDHFNTWKTKSEGTTISFTDSDNKNVNIKYNKLPAGHLGVSNADVINNINYNDSFVDIGAADLTGTFQSLIENINKPIFSPVAGDNDLGVGDAVTYMDPVGKYMDVKDVKNLSLFGELYGITKTAVYDYQWNDQYIKNDQNLVQGSSPLPEGWYYGTPTETSNEDVKYAGSPDQLPPGCANAEKAWNDGWVYRVNYQTAAKFVPTLKEINNPEEALAKERKTEYTFYRIDKTQAERNKLHMNPAYLTDGQTEEQALQGKTYNADGEHLNDPGVYALSDLRIWVEDSGDYNDTTVDSTLSDSNFDEALWVNIPVNMLPLRTVSVNLGDPKEGHDDNWTYTTNLTGDSEGYKASFPLRVFYTVGVSDDVIENSNRINIAGAISPEYIEQNKAKNADWATARNVSQGELEFFSNWYNPLNRYGEYATTNTDYSYGDPVTSFSPASSNRYYSFEKALPIYSTAYTYVKTEDKWRRVVIGEDVGEGADAQTFDATSFGGELIAQDLEADSGSQGTDEQRQKSIWDALQSKGISKDKVQNGDMILLKNHRLTDVTKPGEGTEIKDPFSSNSYYFLPIEYYSLDKDTNNATWTQYLITRKGSEFGSAYSARGITNGDMLCWHDVSGRNTQDYPYLSYSETNEAGNPDPTRGKQFIGAPIDSATGYYSGCNKSEHGIPEQSNGCPSSTKTKNDAWEITLNSGEWVVCAKPGGLRVGDLAQNVQEKGGAYSTPQEQETIKKYVDERYKGVDTAASLNWGYYAQNVTRTANNYYVPTIGQTSNIEHSDIKVNVYLGNNGRLRVMDTTLLVTKLVEPPEGFDMANDALNKEVFNFQVFINGAEGTTDAVVVQWNELQKSWQRQFHYIDLELDSQLFLQTADGSKAMVDESGKRRIVAQDGGYVYADDTNEPYNGDRYYVFIGRNRDTAEKVGTTDTSFRVYHNNSVDDNGTVGTNDVTWDGKQGEKGTFYASTVWLVSEDDYNNKWVLADGNKLDAAQDDFNAENYGGISHNNFELLSIDPNVSETTEISIETPYRTMSSYWTKQLTFGKNANEDGDGEVGKELNEDNLYDGIIPKADRADYFANLNNDEIAKHTAEFTLKHGQALLFGGISSGTVYRVTEKLTSKQLAAGYTLKEVSHNQQVGSISTYRPGKQSIPVYYSDTSTYGWYGGTKADGSFVYPSQYEKDKPENGLMWAISQKGEKNNEQFCHEEPFHHTNAVMWEYYATMDENANGDNHHQPAGFLNDGKNGTSTFWHWENNTNVNRGTHIVQDNPSCYSIEKGGCDMDMGDGTVRHYMFKDGELVDKHYEGEGSGYIRNIGRYLVSPTVHFGVEGEDQNYAETPMTDTKSNTNYTGVYSVFGNTGTYEESANYVNTVEPDVLVITKNMVDMSGKEVAVPPDKEFIFTLKLTSPENGKITASDTLHYWKGNISDLSKAPDRNSYDKINALNTLQLNKADGEDAYTATIKLKAKEAVVLYGLIAGTDYTVTETKDDKYPVVDPKDLTQTGDYYTQTGTIEQNSEVVAPAESQNRADFINQLPSGILSVEKEILDNDPNTEKEFGFTVTLTAKEGESLDKAELTMTKVTKAADGTETQESIADPGWKETKADERVTKLEVGFTLKHGEKVVINGIPLDTTYTVDETNRNGYTLKDIETSGNVSVHGKIASGKIEKAEAAMTFVNVPAVFLPEAGGMGILIFCIIGALLIACATAYIVLNRKKLFNKYTR